MKKLVTLSLAFACLVLTDHAFGMNMLKNSLQLSRNNSNIPKQLFVLHKAKKLQN